MNTAFSLFKLHLLYFVSAHWRNDPCQRKFPSATDLVTILLLTVKSKVTAPLNKKKGKKKQNKTTSLDATQISLYVQIQILGEIHLHNQQYTDFSTEVAILNTVAHVLF